MPIKNYLSSTQLSKNTAAALNSFETGEIDKLIILKNNAPKAVLMSMDAYASMEEEIEDLRLTALALSRIQNFDIEQTLSHEEMMYRHTK
jgi:antitoxin StbD